MNIQSKSEYTARSRNANGRFRQKRGDTHLSTLERTYGEISDRRGDTHLATLRQLHKMSLSKLVRAEAEQTHGPDLNGRARNQDGQLRQKRADTRVDTLRQTYGKDFLQGIPGDWTLGLVRELCGESLSSLTSR
jgi:hypothetical protein